MNGHHDAMHRPGILRGRVATIAVGMGGGGKRIKTKGMGMAHSAAGPQRGAHHRNYPKNADQRGGWAASPVQAGHLPLMGGACAEHVREMSV